MVLGRVSTIRTEMYSLGPTAIIVAVLEAVNANADQASVAVRRTAFRAAYAVGRTWLTSADGVVVLGIRTAFALVAQLVAELERILRALRTIVAVTVVRAAAGFDGWVCEVMGRGWR